MMGPMGMRPGIILLREGTDTSQVRSECVIFMLSDHFNFAKRFSPVNFDWHSTQGKAQLISNINACQAVADAVRTTLGPRGMDKLVADGRRVTISNDGATIMRLLEIEHPAAKTLVDISMSQVRRLLTIYFNY
jgi:T-complex protein 1 subunit eta